MSIPETKTTPNNSGTPSKVNSNTTTQIPSVSLPKGGGAITGMGEKFATNPVTGTGSLTIPIFASPGRSGFGPQLSLSYDSGQGNGPFGLGWSLSLPSITRKTAKGIPQYNDSNESDVFVLSSSEDLVPVLVETNGEWHQRHEERRQVNGVEYLVFRYRPRIEGLFARIERWKDTNSGEIHWRSISKDNIVTVYGKTSQSRLSDPKDPLHIFSWLACESYDDKGNAMLFEYKEENSENIDETLLQEKNKTPETRSANRYIKRIKYGNKTPFYRDQNDDLSQREDWLFELVFDYQDGHYYDGDEEDGTGQPSHVSIREGNSWPARKDPFSRYRSGFEIRTYRLCHRVLMFHHFSELEQEDYLVKSTEFSYDETPTASFITKVTQSGYVKKNGNYLKKSLPSLELDYSKATINEEIREVDGQSLENIPIGIDGQQYRWVDLDGEGISGILTQQGKSWYYKRNISSIPLQDSEGKTILEARFEAVEKVSSIPSTSDLSSQQLMDISGDGKLDLVQFDGLSGYFEKTNEREREWESFVPFTSIPIINWKDPNLKFVDLTGDGLADILVTEDQAFSWYHSHGKEGFAQSQKVAQTLDEEKGPRLVFEDGTQSIFLADFSGDGLTDLVRIRNGQVCYWPNMGYGRFGPKTTLDGSPFFDSVDLFDQKWIRLADIDGSGTTDVLYLGEDGIKIYYNESGNSLSNERNISYFPKIASSDIRVVDLFGNGTACLVWSSPLPNDSAGRQMRYLDLMGGTKPHLLITTKNNMGAETRLKYSSSTKFYLEDKYAGRPWITRLSFPVHVVEKVETFDRISLNRFVTRYSYHHGFYDGAEREFRGFGLVESYDTEEYAVFNKSDEFPDSSNIEESSHIPPILTKTWYHTGAYVDEKNISNQYKKEYFREPEISDEYSDSLLLPDTLLPSGLSALEEQEACRALKGSVLRQEIYAYDSSDKSQFPYSVSETNYAIKLVQPKKENKHSVFFTHQSEAISYHYERNPHDPRISHTLMLEVDSFGNVLRSASIGYGRRQPNVSLSAQDQKKQTQVLATCTENSFTNAIDDNDDYRLPLLCQESTYELTGLSSTYDRFDFDTVDEAVIASEELQYEQEPSAGVQKRLIEKIRTLYRKNDLTGPLLIGQMESLALPFETYKLAFTPELVTKVYGNRVNDSILSEDGGYVHLDDENGWWIGSGHTFYSTNARDPLQELGFAREHFFLPHRFEDQFGNNTTISYDVYSLLPVETRDALDNVVTALSKDESGNEFIRLDYRVLQPWLVKDPNGNRSAVSFDALGLVVGTAIMGKEEENLGDSLEGFEADLDEGIILSHIQNPLANPHENLAKATSRLVYDLFNYKRTETESTPKPNVVYSIIREIHESELENEPTKIQHSFSYSDGFGREVQKKIQAEPGDVDGVLYDPRWLGSGWTIFNNKGKPVKKYEPFFSTTHYFEFARIVGVSPTLFYDPLGRVVATLHPNHTYEKIVFDPWKQETWDVNDTVLQNPKNDPDVGDYFLRLENDEDYLPTWYEDHNLNEEAKKTEAHANTPTVAYADSLGRVFLSIANNGDKGTYQTHTELDIEGNQRSVIDALGRTVMQYEYDMLGNRIKQSGMEAGERFSLNNVVTNPIYSWNSRGQKIRIKYDALQRPIETYLEEDSTEKLVERTVYGEAQGDSLNHRGQVFQKFDGAGVIKNERYDFKGNLLSSNRKLSKDYKNTLDWSDGVNLEDEIFANEIVYDALNRPIIITTPDGSITYPTYNEANLLERMEVTLQGNDEKTIFVKGISYDARGRRESIEYGNGVTTTYEYEETTFRLIRLRTKRDNTYLQDLSYVYDPVGNIIHIQDDSDIQNVVYFQNKRVEPSADYAYDAIYRLITAGGREHLGQTRNGGATNPPSLTSYNDVPRVNLPHPGDGNAMGRYEENYVYDEVGNILEMVHRGTDPSHPGWSRSYEYNESSLIQPNLSSNRLSNTNVANETEEYEYDVHGNIVKMPHLTIMNWDYKDQLRATSMQKVNGGTPETTYYVYDSSGQRVRKVTEYYAPEGLEPRRKEERIYLRGYEIYRKYGGDGSSIDLERQTLHVIANESKTTLIETRTKGDDGSPLQVLRYQYSNHLGSASLELDEGGSIISYEEYYPHGSTSYQAVRKDIEMPLKRYRYISEERDEENDMNYHGARYYAPWLARWISCDPSGITDSLNVYENLRSNPIVLKDPNGRQPSSSDAVQFLAGYHVGALKKGGEMELGLVQLYLGLKFDPIGTGIRTGISTLKFAEAKYWQGYNAQWQGPFALGHGKAGVIGGVINVANAFNPAFRLHVSSRQAFRAMMEGESFEAGMHTFEAQFAAYEFGSSAFGAFSFGYTLVPRASRLARYTRFGFAAQNVRTAKMLPPYPSDSTPAVFRGTTEGWPGSPGLQKIKTTPVSTDPAIATAFATESSRHGRGVVHIATPEDLVGIEIGQGNVLQKIEKELGVDIEPKEFAERASITITVDQARTILKEMGIELPHNINKSNLSDVLRDLPSMTLEQITEFVSKAEAL